MSCTFKIYKKNGKRCIAEIEQGLSSFAIAGEVIKRYYPDVLVMNSDSLLSCIEKMEKNPSVRPGDLVFVMCALCNEVTMDKEDIPAIEDFIQYYSPDWNERPKRVMEELLKLLKKHGEIRSVYAD